MITTTAPVLIGKGVSTLTYALASGDGDWVMRVSRSYPEPWTWRGGRRHEVALLAELRSRGVPCPADATVLEEVDGLPAAILERRVGGSPLRPEDVRPGSPMVQTIATLLDRLHSMDAEDAVAHGVRRDDPTAELRHAATTVGLGPELRNRVLRVVDRLEGRAAIRTLCHRDLRVEHLMVDGDGELTGLLDLGEVGVDDPAIDLALLHGELGAEVVTEIAAAMRTSDPGLVDAARAVRSLWPLLELVPGGETWGDPTTARDRLDALV